MGKREKKGNLILTRFVDEHKIEGKRKTCIKEEVRKMKSRN